MSIAPEPISRPPVEHESRHVLRGVSWETYQKLREDNPSGCLRMTYDRGVLEIMSPSRRHEKIAILIGRMIDEWTMLHDIEIEAGRNTTFSRADLEKGLEADHCYWIANQAAVRGKDEIDLSIDPPPDLALEVDITRSSIPKLPIYQALGVPEVWRWRSGLIEVLQLRGNKYVQQVPSDALEGFPFALAESFLETYAHDGDTALIRRFRQTIAKLPKSS
ncbi:MAG: Uma2 family endonuclease [Pirellulaceae bacterium]|nr:Uma2 family endonuclease [Pirellulaceae bacterium]